MAGLLSRIFEMLTDRPLARFEHANERPFATQEERLRRMLRDNAETEFGKRHGFRRIAALPGTEMWKIFRREIPVRRYNDFLPAIERMKAGEENILVPGRPEMFFLTRGTTGEPKFCPVTKTFLKEMSDQRRLWTRLLHKNHPDAAEGKFLFLSESGESGRTRGGILYETMAGQRKRLAAPPDALRGRCAVPETAQSLPDGEERWFAILLAAIAEPDVRLVAAHAPETLLALARRLDRNAERLLDSLETTNPGRARALREIWRANETLTPADVWPERKILLTRQGGASSFHLPHVAALWGKAAMRCPGLCAAEGLFTLPLRDGDASGVLAVGGHVMEFLPAGAEDAAAEDAAEDVRQGAGTLLAGQLEKGRLYRLVATTSGGFYRYDTGDLLRVTGFRGRTPEVRFERRAGAFLSAAGEKLTENQVVAALETAAANGPLLNGFTLAFEAPDGGAPRHVLALECTGGSDLSGGRGKRLRERLEQLRSVFDYELMRTNAANNERRQDGRLSLPRVVLRAEGSCERPEMRGRPALAASSQEFFEQTGIAAEL